MSGSRVSLRRYVEVIAGQSPPSEAVSDLETGLPFIQGTAEFGAYSPQPKLQCDEAPKTCREGDHLLAVRAPVGELNVADRAYGIGRGLAAIRPITNDVDPVFLGYLLEQLKPELLSMATGSTFEAVTADQIRELKVAWMPPIDEQRRIADFLDDQVGRIDQVIELRKSQHQLLEAAFDSLISQVSSVGMSIQVEARQTGLPWMPQANADWSLHALRYLIKEEKTLVGGDSSSYTLLSLTKRGVIPRDVESNFGKFPASFDSYQAVNPGEIVTCLFDVDETPRTIGLAKEHGMVTGAYTCFSVNTEMVLPEYLVYVLIGIDNQKAFRPLYTGMRKGIQTGRLLGAKVPIPDMSTQRSLVTHLDAKNEHLKSILLEISTLLEILEARKRSLITAAVTGHLDVATARPLTGPWVLSTPGTNFEQPSVAAGFAL